MIKFTIPGRLPGLNEYIAAERTSKYKAAAMKRDAENKIILCARQKLPRRHFDTPVVLHYTFYEKDCRRDLDNVSGYAHKLVQDSLVKGGWLHDDSQKYVVGMTDSFAVDKKNPRVEVEIEEMKNESKT